MTVRDILARINYNRRLRASYAAAFDEKNLWTLDIIGHLARFCYVQQTTGDTDPIKMAMQEGRRQVWLEMNYYLHITDAELADMARVYERKMHIEMERGLDS